jgi:phage terminase small subunit
MEPKTPAKRALAALDAPKPAEPLPERRITAKVRRGIDALVNGDVKTITEAAEKAGLARESLTRVLAQPHVSEHLRQRVMKTLAIQAARAGAVKGELLESANEMVRDRASSFVLGLAGIQPATTPSVNINLEVKAGYVIDLSDDPPPIRTVSPVSAE